MRQENYIEYRANEDQENTWHSTTRPTDDQLLDLVAIEDSVPRVSVAKTSDIYKKKNRKIIK